MTDITTEDRILVLEVIRDFSATSETGPSAFFVMRRYEAPGGSKHLRVRSQFRFHRENGPTWFDLFQWDLRNLRKFD